MSKKFFLCIILGIFTMNLLSAEITGALSTQKNEVGYALLDRLVGMFQKMAATGTGGKEKVDEALEEMMAEAKKAKTLPEKMRAIVYGEDKGARFAWKVAANGLIYSANRIPEIADTIVEIDNAMKWGFNLDMGPFEQWDAIDLQTSVEKMEKDGFQVPEKIKKMIEAGIEIEPLHVWPILHEKLREAKVEGIKIGREYYDLNMWAGEFAKGAHEVKEKLESVARKINREKPLHPIEKGKK